MSLGLETSRDSIFEVLVLVSVLKLRVLVLVLNILALLLLLMHLMQIFGLKLLKMMPLNHCNLV